MTGEDLTALSGGGRGDATPPDRPVDDALALSHALHDLTDRFRLVLENVSDVIVQYDAHGRVLWASPSLRTTFGYDDAAAVGTRLRFEHPDDAGSAEAYVEARMRDGSDVIDNAQPGRQRRRHGPLGDVADARRARQLGRPRLRRRHDARRHRAGRGLAGAVRVRGAVPADGRELLGLRLPDRRRRDHPLGVVRRDAGARMGAGGPRRAPRAGLLPAGGRARDHGEPRPHRRRGERLLEAAGPPQGRRLGVAGAAHAARGRGRRHDRPGVGVAGGGSRDRRRAGARDRRGSLPDARRELDRRRAAHRRRHRARRLGVAVGAVDPGVRAGGAGGHPGDGPHASRRPRRRYGTSCASSSPAARPPGVRRPASARPTARGSG